MRYRANLMLRCCAGKSCTNWSERRDEWFCRLSCRFMKGLFVVTVASEKGGVGKTTIATNLAVYLKALNENLPVTIASFDNHFSVDQMFALGPRSEGTVADLLAEKWNDQAVRFGQYGVQYIPSERRLIPPHKPSEWLRKRLAGLGLEGILILDTRPILDWFTEAALLAADLVLAPVKDRASLINAGALRKVLDDHGRTASLWLVPSLVDARSRLNGEVRVHEFLRFAAAERDYQVVDTQINKSPKVESLASGFSSRIPSVLTHARGTIVHGQFRELAEFVLAKYMDSSRSERPESVSSGLSEGPHLAGKRLVAECPVCCQNSLSGSGHFYFELRSRRSGWLHPGCLADQFDGFELFSFDLSDGLVAMVIDGPGLLEIEPRLSLHLFDASGDLVVTESCSLSEEGGVGALVEAMLGRPLHQAYHELILVCFDQADILQQVSPEGRSAWRGVRRKVLRELRLAGLF
ncbi:MAG: hypothetical protein C0614_11635 [Desulfuromonas sp.]|nr:MAG: hypothetical protein C0614_11635 [Desulfuromonas sp.]